MSGHLGIEVSGSEMWITFGMSSRVPLEPGLFASDGGSFYWLPERQYEWSVEQHGRAGAHLWIRSRDGSMNFTVQLSRIRVSQVKQEGSSYVVKELKV